MDYTKYFNKNAYDLKPSGIRKFFDYASNIKGAVSLGVGEPDFDTPIAGRSEAIKAVRMGQTHYTSNCGLTELRQAIVKYYKTRFDIEYDWKETIVTIGGSEAVDIALRALISQGDEVIVPDPSYVSYAPCVTLAGGTPIPIKCTSDVGFKVTKKELEKVVTDKTKILILSYPNNPTGVVMDEQDYLDIADFIVEHDLLILSDEIYCELSYNSKHFSPANIPILKDRCMIVNGFSKSFAMTGWRIGYLLAPKPIIDIAYKIHQYAIMCAPTVSQYAALACLTDCFENDFSTVEKMKEEYDRRRRYIVDRLNNLGFECIEPQGAFYVFAGVKKFGMDGETFATHLIDKKAVAVVPGSAFGECGKDFVRISYAYSVKDIDKALERIEAFVKEL